MLLRFWSESYFNSLPHAEVDWIDIPVCVHLSNFNSLPHAEVDEKEYENNINHQLFQLTTSRRGRRIRLGYSFSLSYFNSLPHAEVDQKLQMLQQRWKYFNSLPHAEVDAEYDVISSGASKFQLTTSRRGRLTDSPDCPLNWVFQLTTSRRGRQYSVLLPGRQRYFNSLPHAEVDATRQYKNALRIAFQLTTSRRGRQQGSQGHHETGISTHYLTQR